MSLPPFIALCQDMHGRNSPRSWPLFTMPANLPPRDAPDTSWERLSAGHGSYNVHLTTERSEPRSVW